MSVNAFHHISLLTKNRQENLRFYTEILGLRFVKNTVNQENHRMLHYYYGDYQGSPDSVVTFFILPHLGNRYDHQNFIATIGLKLPKNSLDYWKTRLTHYQIDFQETENQLRFQDRDDVSVILTETDLPSLPLEKQVKNEIPGDKQILGLNSSEIHVANPTATSEFFEKFLGWQASKQRIWLNETDFLDILPTNSTKATRMGRGSADHLAFAVKDETELNQLYERAQQQGWQIEKMISRGYFKSLYIREPGGNRMEFATMGPGFTIDEPLETLGESFALPPFLADHRGEIKAHLYPDYRKA